MCEIQSVWKEVKKLWKEGEEIKCLELFSPHRPVASLKMFPCVVSDQIESKEGKHSLLQTTCNRFFLRPNKSTLCFRSCDTFLVLCFIPDISCVGPPYPLHFNPLSHACTFRVSISRASDHLDRQWRAPAQHARAGKQEGEFKGVSHKMLAVRGNPEVVAVVHLLKTRK